MTAQLAFDLPALQAWAREDFIPSPANATALAALDHPEGWTNRRLILQGPKGSGKTHLAHIWATAQEAIWLDPRDLAPGLMVLPPDARVVIDGAHRLREPEVLFHLCNRLSAGLLLMTADAAPRDWGLALPDLISRLQASTLIRIEAPDDDLLSAILAKLFADRQVEVPANLIPYLLPRMERSVEAARRLVADLDARALAAHRPITRALAAEVLDTDAPE